jgi:hypothetical protein
MPVRFNISYVKYVQIIILFCFQHIFPDLDDLVKHYHKQIYRHTEIRAFLILKHGREISKTRLRRIIQKLELRRNNVVSPDILIFEGIQRLHAAGFVDVDTEYLLFVKI